MAKDHGTKWDRIYVAVVVPYKEGSYEIDYEAYRKLIRYFLQPKFVDAGGGLIVNPEAGEAFYLTSEEKKNIVKIAVEEAGGKLPIFSGAIDVTTEGIVRDAKIAKELGVDGIFFLPPMGSGDVTYAWNPERYPEVWIDMLKAIDEAVDLPIIVHPTCGVSPFFGVGLPVGPTVKICNAVPNIVGWKMTYSYQGYKLVAEALRSLEHHVAVLAAPADLYHVNLLNKQFDGAVNGGLCYAMEPMIDHIQAWKQNDIKEACRIWESGLGALNDFVYGDYSRLHIRYKIGAWLRGLVPTPFMRPPQPKPKAEEVTKMRKLLKATGVDVISDQEFEKVLAQI
ncbi:MAG: dihydrodipicolinate synthase family protein [Clostridia bacterium]|nr:dihydrodipicolinate synthase family protein [Clostridia bacterium]